MNVETAARRLAAEIGHLPWVVSIGVADRVIHVYVTSTRHAELRGLRDGYDGFPVVVTKTTPVRPATR